MGGLSIILAATSMIQQINKGQQEKRAYGEKAIQVELQAKQDELSRRRDLNDALAMQAVVFASSGRAVGVGSTLALSKEDIKKGSQDINLIKANAKSKASGLRSAGRQSMISGITGGITGGISDGIDIEKSGYFEKSSKKQIR